MENQNCHNVANPLEISNGAVLAAGAVVTGNVEPYSIVGGVPARCIRMRFSPDQIANLEESQWWERSLSELVEDFPDLASLPALDSQT